ncbi:MAG: hypothetical protein WC519_01195 [Parcubacteria group bacterium]|jgi:hypothetical protein
MSGIAILVTSLLFVIIILAAWLGHVCDKNRNLRNDLLDERADKSSHTATLESVLQSIVDYLAEEIEISFLPNEGEADIHYYLNYGADKQGEVGSIIINFSAQGLLISTICVQIRDDGGTFLLLIEGKGKGYALKELTLLGSDVCVKIISRLKFK